MYFSREGERYRQSEAPVPGWVFELRPPLIECNGEEEAMTREGGAFPRRRISGGGADRRARRRTFFRGTAAGQRRGRHPEVQTDHGGNHRVHP
ncbi:MAG: hypothetical protein L6W00_30205 [Lentisphaeria bacterium]|nr:MAG: hypothetical protein L6W00_30205 [Lentisphaeria bacterium]